MTSYRARPSRSERAKAIFAVAAVYAVFAALLLIRSGVEHPSLNQPPTVLIDIKPPTPPPPPVEPQAGKAREKEGAAGKKAEPTEIVAPEPRLPAPSPVVAAPVAGTGTAPSAGAAQAGSGPGAGGSGSGRGGGGSGSGGGIGTEARLLSGGLGRSDYRRLRGIALSSGQARLAILVSPEGRVARCSVANSSGTAAIDAMLCAILQPRMRFSPARDREGNPISVGVYYVATWQRY